MSLGAGCLVPAALTRQIVPAGAMPHVDTNLPVEDYAPKLSGLSCEISPKPGVVAFRELVLNNLGGGDSGICRDCGGALPSSYHNEGRAWDWTVSTSSPEDVERVARLFYWLFAPGPNGEPDANFRRAGLRYIIWDGKIFSSSSRSWQSYAGKSPHRDHVHFSFGRAGSDGQTSLYEWLGTAPIPTGPPVPLPRPPSPVSHMTRVLALAAGVTAGWLAVRPVLAVVSRRA